MCNAASSGMDDAAAQQPVPHVPKELSVVSTTGFVVWLQAQSSTAAHSAGLAAMDAKADLLATAGYGTRQGRVIAETHVKVKGLQDVRGCGLPCTWQHHP